MTAPLTPRIKVPAPFKTPDWERDASVALGHVMRHTAPLLRTADGTGTKLTISDPLDVSTSVSVDGTKVLGSQEAAIADDASGAANQATVNAILAALRAHGLIAT